MKVAIAQLPGSTGDRDLQYALVNELHVRARLFPHKAKSLAGADAVILPGGSSFGDHLRAGAMSLATPIMSAVKEFAAAGGPVLGIGNGFQILCEAKLLPGALTENRQCQYHCGMQDLAVEDSTRNFSRSRLGEEIAMPIAHRFGRYWIDDHDLQSLESNHQILFRYQDNPNGSVANIAGIRNQDENVFGLMPHPEAVSEHGVHKNTVGARVLGSFLKQPRVEPKVPALEPAAQQEIEALLISCASQMSLDSIHAYLPNNQLLFSVNGDRAMKTSDSKNGVGAYLHKIHTQSKGEKPQNVATTMGAHYMVTEVSPNFSLMTVAYRNKVALARLMKEVEKLNEQLNSIVK